MWAACSFWGFRTLRRELWPGTVPYYDDLYIRHHFVGLSVFHNQMLWVAR